MPKKWSEKLEDGNVVTNDQTVTLRVFHARKKVRGKLSSQCPGGCGQYLTDDEKATHQCRGASARPAIHNPKAAKSAWIKSVIKKVVGDEGNADEFRNVVANYLVRPPPPVRKRRRKLRRG